MMFRLLVLACQFQILVAITWPDPRDFSSPLLANKMSNDCTTALRNASFNTRLKYLDASGRPRSGILSGNTKWFGAFSACTSYDDSRYCLISLDGVLDPNKVSQISYGICVPDVCDENDILIAIENIIKTANERFRLNIKTSTEAGENRIKCYEKPSIDGGVKCAIVFFSFILSFCIIGTIIEIFHETVGDGSVYLVECNDAVKSHGVPDITKNGFVKPAENETSPLLGGNKASLYSNGAISRRKEHTESVELSYKDEPEREEDKQKEPSQHKLVAFFLCFSLLRNSRKAMSTDVRGEVITCLNGLRVISLFWVILGHIYFIAPLSGIIENIADMLHDAERFSMMAIEDGMFAVDSFLLLSGLLVTYNVFKRLKNNQGHVNLGWFYLHRYLRLTPTLMVVILFVAKIYPLLAKSPLWHTQIEDKACRDNWWTNLLYINNFYPTNIARETCIKPSWYLSIDMQLFVITPILFYFFYRFGYKATFVSSAVLILASAIVTAVLVNHYDIDVMGLIGNRHAEIKSEQFFNYIYTKPYCRIQPYIIGLAFGYLMHTKLFRAKSLGWPLALVCWVLAFALGLILIYSPYNTVKHDPHVWSTGENITFASVRHLLWGIAVAWVIYACEYGYGGYVKELLSAKFWIPLSRLNYSAYLIHWHVIQLMFYGYRTGLHYTTEVMVYYFCAALVLCYGVAFIIFVTVEYPCANLEMLIFKSKKTGKV